MRRLFRFLRQLGWMTLLGLIVVIASMGVSIWIALLIDDKIIGLGIVGSIASIVGVPFTWIQVISTKRIAVAANAAARSTELSLRRNHYRSALSSIRLSLRELNLFVNTNKWPLAVLRATDLAGLASEVANREVEVDPEWQNISDVFRQWSYVFRRGTTNRSLDFDVERYCGWVTILEHRVNRESAALEEGVAYVGA